MLFLQNRIVGVALLLADNLLQMDALRSPDVLLTISNEKDSGFPVGEMENWYLTKCERK